MYTSEATRVSLPASANPATGSLLVTPLIQSQISQASATQSAPLSMRIRSEVSMNLLVAAMASAAATMTYLTTRISPWVKGSNAATGATQSTTQV